jgi:hypothetical protein
MEKTELYNYCVERKLLNPSMYVGDMSGCMERSKLSCFTEKEKDIRFNILLMGDLIAKLPSILAKIALLLIRVIPPNILFRKLNLYLYRYNMEHKIFVLKDRLITPRVWQAKGG